MTKKSKPCPVAIKDNKFVFECSECGSELKLGDEEFFCHRCGAEIDWSNIPVKPSPFLNTRYAILKAERNKDNKDFVDGSIALLLEGYVASFDRRD